MRVLGDESCCCSIMQELENPALSLKIEDQGVSCTGLQNNDTATAILRRILPNGIHGIEERLHVMWDKLVNTGLITPPDFVRLSSTEAAKIFGLYPQKGLIAPGSDADIAILDPSKQHTLSAKSHHSALDTSVYEGMKIKGKVLVCSLVPRRGPLFACSPSGHIR